MKRWFYPALAAALVLISLYPMTATGYGIRVMLQLFMWVALAQSWNLISGLTGYVSFGHVAFFGMGAYTAAILIAKAAWPWPVACLAGGVTAMLFALLIGWPCLRLKGPYFAISMLGLNEVLRVAVSYYEGLTGGGNGLSLPTLHASSSVTPAETGTRCCPPWRWPRSISARRAASTCSACARRHRGGSWSASSNPSWPITSR